MVGWARLAGAGGTRAGMSHLPIRKWIRQRKLAWAAKASRGIENSTARDWYLFRTASRETTRNISGFLLGDGRLNYRRENIIETYYTLHVWRGLYPSFGLQHINNPGYNQDRGPLVVPTMRLHLEF